MSRQVLIGAGVLAGVLVLASESRAQGGNIPSPEEVRKKIQEVIPKILKSSPEVTLKTEGVCQITYKKIPTDPKKIAKALGRELGAGQLPKGIDIEKQLGPYMGQITALLNEFLQDLGKFEALQDLQHRSKKIPQGEYRIGLVCKGENPAFFVIYTKKDKEEEKEKEKQKDKFKPVKLKLLHRSKKGDDTELFSDIELELKEASKKYQKKFKGKTPFDIHVKFLRSMGKTKDPLHTP